MTSKAREAAELRAQIASLRATLEKLERRVEQIEGVDGQDNSGGEHEDTEERDHSNAKASKSNETVLPAELWLMIGQYLIPGSRNVLRLASASRHLYSLFLPRLLQHLRSEDLLDHRFVAYRRTNLPLLQKHLKSLSLSPVKLAASNEDTPALINATNDILQACARTLQSLSIDMTGISDFMHAFPYVVFEKLEMLELSEAPANLPYWFASRFPALRTLDLSQSLEGDAFDLEVWRGIASLEKLEDLKLQICDHRKSLVELPDLLTKISQFDVTCNSCVLSLLNSPKFNPKHLIFGNCIEWPADEITSQQLWRKATALGLLVGIEIGAGFPSDLLHQFGLPKNLTRVQFSDMKLLTVKNQAVLDRIRTVIREAEIPDLEINVSVTTCPERDTPEYNALFDELVFWDSFNDVDHRMSLGHVAVTVQDAMRIREIEDLLRARKLFARLVGFTSELSVLARLALAALLAEAVMEAEA